MHKALAVAALLTAALAAPAVMADPPPWAQANGHHKHDNDQGDDGWHGERERHWDGDRYSPGDYRKPKGYQKHEWHRGDRVPVVYRSSRYVVRDYGAYRLDAPPPGHQWVRVDNDVVLTTIATGIVAAVVYNIFN